PHLARRGAAGAGRRPRPALRPDPLGDLRPRRRADRGAAAAAPSRGAPARARRFTRLDLEARRDSALVIGGGPGRLRRSSTTTAIVHAAPVYLARPPCADYTGLGAPQPLPPA